MIVVSDDPTSRVQPDASRSSTDEPVDVPAPVGAGMQAPSQPAMPTPEERLAETLLDDAEVGSDGTGMGELP